MWALVLTHLLISGLFKKEENYALKKKIKNEIRKTNWGRLIDGQGIRFKVWLELKWSIEIRLKLNLAKQILNNMIRVSFYKDLN